jgi:hypothetical protein
MSYLLVYMITAIFPDLESQRSRSCRMVVEMSKSVEQVSEFNHLWNMIARRISKVKDDRH